MNGTRLYRQPLSVQTRCRIILGFVFSGLAFGIVHCIWAAFLAD
jgi:hypothetical protein